MRFKGFGFQAVAVTVERSKRLGFSFSGLGLIRVLHPIASRLQRRDDLRTRNLKATEALQRQTPETINLAPLNPDATNSVSLNSANKTWLPEVLNPDEVPEQTR